MEVLSLKLSIVFVWGVSIAFALTTSGLAPPVTLQCPDPGSTIIITDAEFSNASDKYCDSLCNSTTDDSNDCIFENTNKTCARRFSAEDMRLLYQQCSSHSGTACKLDDLKGRLSQDGIFVVKYLCANDTFDICSNGEGSSSNLVYYFEGSPDEEFQTCSCDIIPNLTPDESKCEQIPLFVNYIYTRFPFYSFQNNSPHLVLNWSNGTKIMPASRIPGVVFPVVTPDKPNVDITLQLSKEDTRPGIVRITFGREVNISCSSNSTPKGIQRQFPSSLCVPCIAGSCGGLFLLIVVVIIIVCIVVKRKRKRPIRSTTVESPSITEPQTPAPDSESHPYNEAYELCTLQPQSNHPDYEEALSASSDGTDVRSYVTRHQNQAQPLVALNGNSCPHSVTEESEGDYHELDREAPRNVLVENTYDHAD